MVCQLHRQGQEIPQSGHKVCRENNWTSTASPGRHLYDTLPPPSMWHFEGEDTPLKPPSHPATLWQALLGHYSPHLQTAEQFHPQGHHRTKPSHNPHTLHPAHLHFC